MMLSLVGTMIRILKSIFEYTSRQVKTRVCFISREVARAPLRATQGILVRFERKIMIASTILKTSRPVRIRWPSFMMRI